MTRKALLTVIYMNTLFIKFVSATFGTESDAANSEGLTGDDKSILFSSDRRLSTASNKRLMFVHHTGIYQANEKLPEKVRSEPLHYLVNEVDHRTGRESDANAFSGAVLRTRPLQNLRLPALATSYKHLSPTAFTARKGAKRIGNYSGKTFLDSRQNYILILKQVIKSKESSLASVHKIDKTKPASGKDQYGKLNCINNRTEKGINFSTARTLPSLNLCININQPAGLLRRRRRNLNTSGKSGIKQETKDTFNANDQEVKPALNDTQNKVNYGLKSGVARQNESVSSFGQLKQLYAQFYQRLREYMNHSSTNSLPIMSNDESEALCLSMLEQFTNIYTDVRGKNFI